MGVTPSVSVVSFTTPSTLPEYGVTSYWLSSYCRYCPAAIWVPAGMVNFSRSLSESVKYQPPMLTVEAVGL